MAKILALDTSTTACSVALNLDGVIDERFVVAPQDHTQRLLPMVDDLLQAHGLKLRDLNAIAFGAGPGSFTGLRICLGIVQGLAFGAKLPVIPISSLAATAAAAARELQLPAELSLIPAFDARMDEVYWGAYAFKAGELKALQSDAVAAPARLHNAMQSASYQNIIGVGDGWACAGMPRELTSAVELSVFPHAQDVARLALKHLAEGKTLSALAARPIYIRNEVSWKKRQKLRPTGD